MQYEKATMRNRRKQNRKKTLARRQRVWLAALENRIRTIERLELMLESKNPQTQLQAAMEIMALRHSETHGRARKL